MSYVRQLPQVVVDLRGNGFGNAGAAALATALKQHANEHLTELDIGYNEIKDDGACAIAQVRCGKRCCCIPYFSLMCRQTMGLHSMATGASRCQYFFAPPWSHEANSSAAFSCCVCWARRR